MNCSVANGEFAVSQAAARRIYVPESANVARTFMAELRQVHRELLGHVQSLESMSGNAVPDRSALTTARWKLGQASLARRMLAGRICEYFETRCGQDQVQALLSLRSADREMLSISAVHLRKWTADTIYEDWAGYCSDGRFMRRRLNAHIALEQRILYPLLEAAARRI